MMTNAEKELVMAVKSKVNAINIVIARIEDAGGMNERDRKALSWLFRTGASAIMAMEPNPEGVGA